MRAVLVAGPATEPMSILEARMHLRNPEVTSNNAEIVRFIRSAREQVEHKTGRVLISQTWDVYLDGWPTVGYCVGLPALPPANALPVHPVQSVTSVKYLDAAGALQTVPSTDYELAVYDQYSVVRLLPNKSWPSESLYAALDPVVIRVVAGWPSADEIPENIRHWMKLFLAAADQNRGLLLEREAFLTPFAERLLDKHRTMGV